MAILTDFHLRGMTDLAGAPNAAIDTIAIEHHSDGTIKYTAANGKQYTIRDVNALILIGDCLNQNILPPHQV